MITESTVYWITRLSYLQGGMFAMFGILVGLSSIGLIGSIICCAMNITSNYNGERLMPHSKRGVRISIMVLLPALLFLISAFFVPNTKEYCAIKVIPKIINNKEVQELPNKVVELANEWIEELKPNKSTENK